jgi:hypothetical protein
MWPYQTPEIIQAFLNAPAYFIAAPVWWIVSLQTAEHRHPVLFIASIAVWFSVGHGIDSGRLAAKRRTSRPWLRIVWVVVAGAAAYVAVREVSDGATWWSKYGGFDLASILILVRIIGFVPWGVFLAALGARTVIRWRTC